MTDTKRNEKVYSIASFEYGWSVRWIVCINGTFFEKFTLNLGVST